MKGERLQISIHGAVQGVGFRPFIFRLANELELNGWVSNSAGGVLIEVEGARPALEKFLIRVENEKPPHAVIQSFEPSFLDAIGYDFFTIRESRKEGHKTAFILPDIATCIDCRDEILDPANRRFRYPFTNCTNCGPRFSIIEALPYDRANTSMREFTMCDECEREYHDPRDRRFHAQPNACPRCGPQLQLWDEAGAVIAEREDALIGAVERIRSGKILALKGLGGFQLVVDAANEGAVVRLRQRKQRGDKPFALMYPSLDLVYRDCVVSELEKRLLLSPESPIVLLLRKSWNVASSIAPGNPNLGVMFPYTPLYHLLLRELNRPVVATSGNLSDEPICIDEREALDRLHGIADAFLVHDRPILRHVDDSIVRIMCGREVVLRRARGYAPLPITLQSANARPGRTREPQSAVLAVGAHLKNTVALNVGENIFVSQHIGDLQTEQAYRAFRRAAQDLPHLYGANIDLVACDLHPDYVSTNYAANLRTKKIGVQHHWAHVAACMAENQIDGPALGVSWDGTGYGLDGTIWGGEFFLAREGSFERIAHFRTFRLPGGELAIKQPRRSAFGLLYEIFGDNRWPQGEFRSAFPPNELELLRQMLAKKINAPLTSSIGRLFDAVASLLGLRQQSSFEGQAAMELEFAAAEGACGAYSFMVNDKSPRVIDWQPAILQMREDYNRNESVGTMSAKFHCMLTEVIVDLARKVGEPKVILSGGCFQNRYLTERTISRLREEGFHPYWHQRVPPNDGGIALGQIVAAIWEQRRQA